MASPFRGEPKPGPLGPYLYFGGHKTVMRLMRITTNYPSYLKNFYAERPELKSKTYAQQYQTLMADCYGWADFWTHAFGKLGYEVWEPVGNAEPMQKAWAVENDINYDEQRWLLDIVFSQAKSFQPDIVLVNDYTTYKAEFFQFLRSECPSIRLVIGWCGAPYNDSKIFREYDLVLSNIPSLVTHFRKEGCQCEHMNHAFEPTILNKIQYNASQITDFTFVGSIMKSPKFHNQREQLVKRLIHETGIEIWANAIKGPEGKLERLLLKRKLYKLFRAVKSFHNGGLLHNITRIISKITDTKRPIDLTSDIDPSITRCSGPPLFGISMFERLANSLVTLNTHIDISMEYASNMRLYEATGVGTCLLTEWQRNLHELFEPGVEVVTYQSAEEAVEKVRYLLSHDEERCKIAKAGQQRTLKDHTFDIRAQQLDTLIKRMVK